MPRQIYDPSEDMWPDLKRGRVILMPARVGVDRTNGKVLVGWAHVVQSIKVIFATRFHERVLRRWVGSFVPHLLGESAVERVITRFYWAICSAIDLWEPNYRIQQIVVGIEQERLTGVNAALMTPLTSTEQLRLGHLTTRTEGIYRPRAHVGDDTPEKRRILGLVGNAGGVWERGS